MLKLTYTDVGLNLERITSSNDHLVEQFVTQRAVLAVRTGQPICIQPGRASFLVPVHSVNLKEFKATVQGETMRSIDLTSVDHEFYEISLRGTWIAGNHEAYEGMFLTSLNDRIELFIDRLWNSTQITVPSNS
jgi:hypothetical protein